MMTYSEFRKKRIEETKKYEESNPWMVGIETDFEGVTELAYSFYLKGKGPLWSK